MAALGGLAYSKGKGVAPRTTRQTVKNMDGHYAAHNGTARRDIDENDGMRCRATPNNTAQGGAGEDTAK